MYVCVCVCVRRKEIFSIFFFAFPHNLSVQFFNTLYIFTFLYSYSYIHVFMLNKNGFNIRDIVWKLYDTILLLVKASTSYFFRGLRASDVTRLIRLNLKVKFHWVFAHVKLFEKSFPFSCKKQNDFKPVEPRFLLQTRAHTHTYLSSCSLYILQYSRSCFNSLFASLFYFFFRIVFIYLFLCTTSHSAAPCPLLTAQVPLCPSRYSRASPPLL